MNAVEMQHSFQSKMQSVSDKPFFFESYRIEKLLNEAQTLYVDRYAPLIDSDEEVRKRLSVLIKHTSLAIDAAVDDNLPNGQFVSLPVSVRRVLTEYVTTASGTTKVVPLKYDSYLVERDNPFKQPDSDLVWRVDYGVGYRHELITDGALVPVLYKMRYLVNPRYISISDQMNCQLPSKDHEEIVNIALSLVSNPLQQE